MTRFYTNKFISQNIFYNKDKYRQIINNLFIINKITFFLIKYNKLKY